MKRHTTFRTTVGAKVYVEAPEVYVAPGITPEDVTSPEEMREALREALREELRFSFDLPCSKRLGEADFSHVASMIRAANRLFIQVGPTGEFYVLDEDGFRLLYRWPNKFPDSNWRGTFFGHCYWSAQNVVAFAGFGCPEPPYGNALVFIDPETLTVSRLGLGGGSYEELFACIEHDGALYVTGGYGHRRFFRLSDTQTYTQLSTLPAGADGPRALTYFNGNFVVACESGKSVWRSPDGVNWTKIMDTYGKAIAITTDGNRVLVADKEVSPVWAGKVYYINKDWSYGVAFRLTDFSIPYNFVRMAEGWSLCGGMNKFGAIIANPIQEYYFTFNPQMTFMLPQARIIDFDLYGGKLIISSSAAIWSGSPTKESQPSIISIIDPYTPIKLYPLTFTPWKDTSISANDETDPIPTFGFTRKTVSFTSNTAGTLSIQMDGAGDGGWEEIESVPVGANERIQRLIDYDCARIKLVFDSAATVTAKLVMAP